LLDAVDREKVTLEDIGAVEGLLTGSARARAETTNDGSLVVGSDEMSVAVILSGKATLVELASRDGTLLRTLVLVREHVCLQILVQLATVWVWASVSGFAIFLCL